MNTTFDPRDLPSMFPNALQPAIRLHRAWNLPMAVWENGAVVWKSPDEIDRELAGDRRDPASESASQKTPQNVSGN